MFPSWNYSHMKPACPDRSQLYVRDANACPRWLRKLGACYMAERGSHVREVGEYGHQFSERENDTRGAAQNKYGTPRCASDRSSANTIAASGLVPSALTPQWPCNLRKYPAARGTEGTANQDHGGNPICHIGAFTASG